MDESNFLRERFRWALRAGGALTAFCVVGAVLSALFGAPDLVSWPVAAGAAVVGWRVGNQLMQRYEGRR
ncbi:hypothetical protein [Streptomyces sp. WMMB303]|uniref:hypothetical protein n=1 Tax=Streptomyces sp. WMMB303 TaxID=3034154 RepID=UPI0023EC58CD|nr:hypothetical protein [Streptomyces sp. WMMB303]MDF4251404.1 hypothetical protein [Streptomyces sp. WMMB303]